MQKQKIYNYGGFRIRNHAALMCDTIKNLKRRMQNDYSARHRYDENGTEH